MNVVKLTIDTSHTDHITIRLDADGTCHERTSDSTHMKAQMTLPLIDELLRETKLALPDVTHIYVNTGPGSFTGLRVGVTIANTLGWALGVPVNDKPIGESVTVVYEKSKFDLPDV